MSHACETKRLQPCLQEKGGAIPSRGLRSIALASEERHAGGESGRSHGRGREQPAGEQSVGSSFGEELSGAAVWVTSIILMTLQPSYVAETPPTFSKV